MLVNLVLLSLTTVSGPTAPGNDGVQLAGDKRRPEIELSTTSATGMVVHYRQDAEATCIGEAIGVVPNSNSLSARSVKFGGVRHEAGYGRIKGSRFNKNKIIEVLQEQEVGLCARRVLGCFDIAHSSDRPQELHTSANGSRHAPGRHGHGHPAWPAAPSSIERACYETILRQIELSLAPVRSC